MSSCLLAAVLIVRDEAVMVPGCLESLVGVVDEIHVLDTGSVDGTPQVAAGFGAVVRHRAWDDDFAAARNAAADGVDARWVLAVDADHRVTADAGELRRVLADVAADAVRVEVHDEHHSGAYRQLETRLYRPDVLSWTGRVHERLGRNGNRDERLGGSGGGGEGGSRDSVAARTLRLRHLGHATYEGRIRRAERNRRLAHRMLDELRAEGADADRERIAYTLMVLGRDCAAAERRQQAVDVFESVRELFPGTPEWLRATDGLARLMLAEGYDKACLVLAGQMRDAGGPPAYCDWLTAQALAQLGDPQEAARLLAGITEVVDTTGRRHDRSALREVTEMVDRLRVLTKNG